MAETGSRAPISGNTVTFCENAEDVYRDSEPEIASGGPAVSAYATFVKEIMEAEEKRNASMESRALVVVTSSGTLVTLLLALAALATRDQTFHVPLAALILACITALLFVGSALFAAVLTNRPNKVWGLRPECLQAELWERWGKAGDDPVAKTTATRLMIWQTSHGLSQKKAKFLDIATKLQFAAIVILGATVIVELISAQMT